MVKILGLLHWVNWAQVENPHYKTESNKKSFLQGKWKIDYLNSFSQEDGGIFFESLSFEEAPFKIDGANGLLQIFRKNEKVLRIQALQKLGDANVLEGHRYEVGNFDIDIRVIKNDTLIDATGIYALVHIGPLSRLYLFFLNAEAPYYFKDGLLFELEHFIGKKKNMFVIKNNKLKGSFKYQRNKNHDTAFPKKVNDKKMLNYYGLKGNVINVSAYSYEALDLGNKNLVCGDLIAYDKLSFNSKGEVRRNEFQNFKWEKQKTVFEFKGDYYEHRSINITPSDSYPDIIRTTRTEFRESRNSLKQNDTIHLEESILKNGLKKHGTLEGQSNKKTLEYHYNARGDLISFLIFSPTKVNTTSYYFQYLIFDEKKNWTKRVVFEDKYYQQPKSIEVRSIEYSE